ncbi:putative aldehyde dehydrogenase [Lyophyllum shimeji]|uniref:Aldehyde dehydrogenase n=1 Tax=Lyophyllum shimeji TaxID=47721 RepID=A0A9P3PPS6_LYOSH|nr:putative aldehyde dehydrogenase [Lyophyllum shimeji]
MPPPFTPLCIDGQWVPSSTNATFDVTNPASGQVVGQAASASSEDCKAAVDSAAKAFETWEHSTNGERAAIFIKAAELAATEKYKAKIVETTGEETGAMEYWCMFNAMIARGALMGAAGLVNQLTGQTLPSAVPGAKVEVHRRAAGVILSIAPWNAPFALTLRAVAVPILCGNTVVLKSSEYSPRSQAVAVELLHEAGLPRGVLNYVSMSREAAPALTAELIAHPKVRKVNFTGSDRVGRIIAMEAAKHLKPCILELGGKAPVVVLDDAPVSDAAKAIVHGAMAHSGQVCMSTERVIVQRGVAQPLVAAVRELCASESLPKLGPLFSEASAENVVRLVKEAVGKGAELVLGDMERRGCVVGPHVLLGVQPGKGMELWERESFGPVVAFAVVDTKEEAVELANDSEYSLTASVWTKDIYAANEVASRIRAGYVNINGSTIHSEPLAGLRGLGPQFPDVRSPFVLGRGASGYGRFDVDGFTDLRVVVTHPPGRRYPPFS